MKSTHVIIRKLLSQGRWLAPHEVRGILWNHACPISPEATTARIRDLRKAKYGRHDVAKRRRKGTPHLYEYTIPTNQQQEA